MGFEKRYGLNSFNIAPNELKLGVWIKDGKVYIPTKFQENLRAFNFLCNLCITLSIHPMVIRLIKLCLNKTNVIYIYIYIYIYIIYI